MSDGKYYVYQSTIVDNDRLQQQLDNSFNIVTSETLEEHRSKIVAICSIQRTIISGELIRSLPALKVIACNSVGYDHVDMQSALELGIRVGHAPFVVD